MVATGAGNRVEFDTEYSSGIAHFMEHMRFKGTYERTAKDLLKTVAHNGGEMNAWTSEDNSGYYITIPEENIEVAFDCLAGVALYPIFPEYEIAKEKDVVGQEIMSEEDDIDENLYQETMLWAFSNSLTYPILGFKDSVANITRDELLKFNKEFYNKEQLLVVLSARDDYSHFMEKYFGIPDGVLAFRPSLSNVKYGKSVAGKIKKEGYPQSSIMMSFGSDKIHHAAHHNRALLHVFNTMFGAEDDSRLFMRIREDLGLVYGIDSILHNALDGTLFSITTEAESYKEDTIVAAINEEINKMCSDKPTSEELVRAKNRLKSSLYGFLDTSLGKSNLVVKEEFHNYSVDSKFLAQIDSVTVDEVFQMSKDVFSGNKYVAIGTGTD